MLIISFWSCLIIIIFLFYSSNLKYLKCGLVFGAITLAVIACGVLPAVIVSQVLSTTTVKNLFI